MLKRLTAQKHLARLRQSLLAGDQAVAKHLLETVSNDLIADARYKLSLPAFQFKTRIMSILDHPDQGVQGAPVIAPTAPWIIGRAYPETRTHIYDDSLLAGGTPDVSDAWFATKSPERALHQYLTDQWIYELQYLDRLPWRMHELAVRLYGHETAETLFEASLDTIHIDRDSGPTRASIELFGLTLPLPVVKRTPIYSSEHAPHPPGTDGNSETFTDTNLDEAWLRNLLTTHWQNTAPELQIKTLLSPTSH
ncbi:hypothetical protein [Ahniella affigens]|uniref:hypothetical protein n=1 Tax=Ahniella affigens TaxID=2021234 RepID=UPI0011B26A08|nr:hypothetical protein [Ahniella affigens]